MTVRPTQYQGDETVSLLRATQENAARTGAKPYLRSTPLTVNLVNGTVTVPHGLKRKPAGWLLHSVLGTAHAFVPTAPDTKTITITAIAVGSCVLEVW